MQWVQGSLGVPYSVGNGVRDMWVLSQLGHAGRRPGWAGSCPVHQKKPVWMYSRSPLSLQPHCAPGQYGSTETFTTDGHCSPPLTSSPSPWQTHPCSPTRMNISNFPLILACVKQVLQGRQVGLEKTGMLHWEGHKGAQQRGDTPKGKQSCGDDAGLISPCTGKPKGAVGRAQEPSSQTLAHWRP